MTGDEIVRRWRRWRFRHAGRPGAVLRAVGMVLVVGSTVLSSVTLYRVEQQRCETRREANRAIRSAIVTAVDEAATYAHVPGPERIELRRRVDERVLHEYPPPDC